MYYQGVQCPIARFETCGQSVVSIFGSHVHEDTITKFSAVAQRIKLKIATLTFKTLASSQPKYLADIFHPHMPSRHLRSSDKFLRSVPRANSAAFLRSFSHAAPTIWNSSVADLEGALGARVPLTEF